MNSSVHHETCKEQCQSKVGARFSALVGALGVSGGAAGRAGVCERDTDHLKLSRPDLLVHLENSLID